MMKMMILAPRRVGMTHDEFRHYVINVHGPLVKSITEVAADIRHYHYNLPVLGASDNAMGHPLAELDIVTQGFFDSRDAQLLNMQHPRFKTILRPDESNFANTKIALMHYTDEREVIAGPKTSHKLFYFRRRAANLTRELFQAKWLAEFPPVLENLPLRKEITRYVQNQVQVEAHHPDGSNTRFYDVMDEFWLKDESALARVTLPNNPSALRELEALLTVPERTRAYIGTMIPNIP
jgi:EthD domain